MKKPIHLFIFMCLAQNYILLSDHEVTRPQSCPITIAFSHGTTETFAAIGEVQTEEQTRFNNFIRRPQPTNRRDAINRQRQQARESVVQAARERRANQQEEPRPNATDETTRAIVDFATDERIRAIIASTQEITLIDNVASTTGQES